MTSFSDMNVFFLNEELCQNQIISLLNLDYKNIVINYCINELKKKEPNNAKKKSNNSLPSPNLILSKLNFDINTKKKQIFTRFTTILTDPMQIVTFQKDKIIQSYDILSVQPTTEKLFLSACKDLEIDIISLDLTQRLSFVPKRTAIGCAIERGIVFEILYSPMIRNITSRQNIISNANLLVDLCKGKNIIVSSGCCKVMEIKGPYDIINLNLLFGLNELQAKNAITLNPHLVFSHALARKTKGVLNIVPICSLNKKISKEELDLTDDDISIKELELKKDELTEEHLTNINDEPVIKKRKT